MARNARLSSVLLLALVGIALMFMTSAGHQGFLPGLLRLWRKQAHAGSIRRSPLSVIVKDDMEGLPNIGEGHVGGRDNNHEGFDASLFALPIGERGGSVAATWLAFSMVPVDEPLAGP
mmetsp:Transcript_64866/g.128184  ORF Transcript_64866/g.128184 Transcript_64866/m.128184 type:complete len:118 (+) Transcript_64866:82-435(+)|eukprot:CAMPEP_0172728448 /NCGR_PEP_ID=MMETSP1074-20121228/92248_1 /TAXON_ID=2916 /ORGANISM="Ceratium fusus, Strain PA161109" /LENGTH=117 /DNA_ID=CAMNT_0013555697 /DNA_START=57 /DNA_END=410 /DNA_ORIENTATION=+